MKATMLSYAAKRGYSHQDRLSLGHHVHPYQMADVYARFFLCPDGCMAQRGRCPDGRPSVSANKRIHDADDSVVKWQLYKPSKNTEYDQQSPRECRYSYWRVQ